ncbi:DUF3392 domain-containing protein [Salinispirillum sp. LH 10-3-1]|uniref:DUF3392 domain-containing protein n=1 Tax=Salinispirillum sp. LH 10-3-1 TaxID=2952525 RepID=A0AB38YFN5_9GAMM
MQSLLVDFSGLFTPHLRLLCTAFIASLLVIYGRDINRGVLGLMRRAHFIVRTLVFVILCAVGYGFVTVQGGIWLTDLVSRIDRLFLGIIITLAFIGVGMLAERRAT